MDSISECTMHIYFLLTYFNVLFRKDFHSIENAFPPKFDIAWWLMLTFDF